MISSAIWDKSTQVNFSGEAKQIAVYTQSIYSAREVMTMKDVMTEDEFR